MFRLTEKRFADYFKDQPETGMDYFVTTAYLKNGQQFPQVVVTGGRVTRVRHHKVVPFSEADVAYFEVTHAKWDWQKSDQ